MEKNKKKAFIHISDLHIVTDEITPGKKNEKQYEKSWLQVSQEEQNSDYINCFCTEVKSRFSEHDFYLIVSGDIADQAHKKEYACAIRLFTQIKEALKIKSILLVPGNHDVDRDSCKNAAKLKKNLNKEAYTLHKEKFKTFSSFYTTLFDNSFSATDAIINTLLIDNEKLMFVGMNSNYKLDYDDGNGAFDMQNLESSFQKIKTQHDDYSIIVVFHHNLENQHVEDPAYWGSFKQEDYIKITQFLKKNSVACALYGNEHIENIDLRDGLYISDAGRFATREGNSSFKVYELNQSSQEVYFNAYRFLLANQGNAKLYPWGKWNTWGSPQKIVLRNSTNISVNTIDSNPTQNPIEKPQQHNGNKKQNSTGEHTKAKEIEESPSQDYITNLIKGKNIFHQGHFHWGENSRSLNWIDITSLFKDRETKKEIQKKLIEFIKSKKIDYDAVIGIGMGGNILATPLLVEEGKQYTYLPYSYRYDKSHEVEQNPNFDSNVCNILMITDVVHSGNSILELIKEKSKDSFQSINEIHVISLLYTGRIGEDVFNSDKRIKFHPMASVEIAQCPYDDENKCPNFQNKFCDIFELDPKDDTTKSDLGNASKN